MTPLPIDAALPEFRRQHADSAEAESIADALQQEIDVWRAHGTDYGYVFFVATA